MPEHLESQCKFATERLSIFGACNYQGKTPLANHVIDIMTPEVTRSLPSDWKKLNTIIDANNWLDQMSNECSFLLVQKKGSEDIIGFIFLYEPDKLTTPFDIRLGYLLNENSWGLGLGSELIKGLLDWCESSGIINAITGGVEPDNIGSIKVLTKNGFTPSEDSNHDTLFYVYTFQEH